MSAATYWLLVVPLIGIGLTLPVWAWLYFTRERKAGREVDKILARLDVEVPRHRQAMSALLERLKRGTPPI
jgi:hypothetical protein